eukprot:jgi/Ulvmu1/10323/UM061_0006.1
MTSGQSRRITRRSRIGDPSKQMKVAPQTSCRLRIRHLVDAELRLFNAFVTQASEGSPITRRTCALPARGLNSPGGMHRTRRPRPANVDYADSDMPFLTKSHSIVASGSGGLETRPAQPCRAPSAPSLPAKTVWGEGTCSTPATPLQGQVPGVVFRYSINTDQASVQYMDRRLKRYRRIHNELRKQGRSKPDLIANKELRSSQPQRYLGHPLGVRPGDLFEGRGELAALGIHSLMAAGIDWHGAHPAFAVFLSGGYADDEDAGAQIWYTGMGGQRKQQQVQPQQLEKGNLALKTSMDLQTPVRVCRAASERERDGATECTRMRDCTSSSR